jgi:mannose-6-phosphate isomerase-like protein (cupin superfamily)
MTVTFHNLSKLRKLPLGHSKKVLADTKDSHIWIHGDDPGTQGPMHRHTADEIFYCVQGECTFTLAGGRREKLKPGMVVFIPKDDYYQLENTGDEYMILLGMRSEPSKLARFGAKGETVGDNLWAIENRHVIAARKRELAKKRTIAAKKGKASTKIGAGANSAKTKKIRLAMPKKTPRTARA